ncbi:MAG: tyrosine-protein phosphatase [Sphingomonas sp.]
MNRRIMLPLIMSLFTSAAYAAPLDTSALMPVVTRTAPDALTVTWSDRNPVDVYLSYDPNGTLAKAQLVSKGDRDGTETVKVRAGERAYFLLKDRKSGITAHVAERVLPLQQGSNFRDVGGYPAVRGKHVRWGLIYRSGGQPLLTDADVDEIHALKLANLVDLRSSEERVIAPTRVDGIPYQAVGYSMQSLTGGGTPKNGEGVYRKMPSMMAPQLRLVFQDLLARKGALAYNCSAGQDRTGFVTAMVLSALGVPRDTIVADYHLSTIFRRPEWEMPRIDTVAQANNPVAMFFAKYQADPAAAKPKPLKDPDGTAFLSHAFDEIDHHWGSVDAYLEQEIGVSKAEMASLRRYYLE